MPWGFSYLLEFQVFTKISSIWWMIMRLTIAFPDTLITSAPLGIMVESVFNWRDQGDDFAIIQDKLAIQISRTSAFIMVDDLATW